MGAGNALFVGNWHCLVCQA